MGQECGSSGACEPRGAATQAGGGGSSGGGACPCGTPGCGGDPIDCAIGMWSCAFFQAMKQVQADLLKPKIQKAWGAKMEKAADAVLESMGVHWQSMVAQSQAKAQLKDKLRALWQEGR